MILLDAYAIVALLAEEPAADEVEELLRSGDAGVTLVNLCEAIYILDRRHGIALEESRAAIEPLLAENVALIEHSYEHLWRAAELRVRHFDKKTQALSFADCLLMAATRKDDSLATSDRPIAHVARDEGIGLIPLPDRNGKRP